MKKKLFLTLILIVFGVLVLGAFSVSAATFGELTYSTLPNGTIGITGYNEYATDEIVIPSEINGKTVTYIDEMAFCANTSLKRISIPDTVTGIGDYAFSNCWSLESINIPSNLSRVGKYAFDDCGGLENITIPSRLTQIGDYAFSGSRLKSVIIPNTVTSIGKGAFSASSLKSVIIPNTVTSIGEYAFSETGLESVVLSNSLTNIEDFAFSDCKSLVRVIIPDSVKTISNAAFSSCTALTSVLITKNVTSIGDYAFNNCSNIKTVFYAGSESQWNEISFHNNNENLTNALVINVTKRTYKLETNCAATLSDITDYVIFDMPLVENDGKIFTGWYDNATLSGDPVTFPYYGDTTTLYAAWTDRTGKSFDDAFIAKANQEYTVSTVESGQLVYFEFVPKLSKEYHFYTTGSKDTYGYLYNSSKSQLTSDDDDGDGNNFYISYNLTAGETYYIAAKLYSGTGTFTFVAEEPVDYKINSVAIKDMSGNSLQAIPTGTFLATISFTNVSSSEDTVIILAQYTAAGAFKDLMYIQIEDVPTGSTIKLSIPVKNSNGDVAKLKAFCWESFDSLTPMGNSASFPAEL